MLNSTLSHTPAVNFGASGASTSEPDEPMTAPSADAPVAESGHLDNLQDGEQSGGDDPADPATDVGIDDHDVPEGHAAEGNAAPTNGNESGASESVYDYRNADGNLVFQVVRSYDPTRFRQRRPDPTIPGAWIWDLQAVPLLPYNAPALRDAQAQLQTGSTARRMAFLVEGEKDADRLIGLGLLASTNPMGAGKWRDEYSSHFEGLDVVILPDNDLSGRKHADQVAESLAPFAARVRVVELPDLALKEDVSDWLDFGGTVEDLTQPAREAPPWVPAQAESSAPMPTTDNNEVTQPTTLATQQAVNGNLRNPVTVAREEASAELQPGESAAATRKSRDGAGPTPEGAEQAPQPPESTGGMNPKPPTQKEKAAKAVADRNARKKEEAENKPRGKGASRVDVTRAGAAKGVKPRSASPPGNSAQKATREPDLIKEEIRAEQEKIKQNEGNTVVSLVSVGRWLVELQIACKEEGKTGWLQHLKSLGFKTPRPAGRLQELGASWWAEIGTLCANLRDRLPTDIQKLVMLCRLSPEQLKAYVDATDVKEVSRQRVVTDVKKLLGTPEAKPKPRKPKPGTVDKVVVSFAKSVSKKVASLGKMDRNVIDVDALHSQFHDAVDDAFAKLAAATEPATGDE